MPLTRERVDHFDLARFDIDEPVSRFARASEERPGWIMSLDTSRLKRGDMGCGEGDTLHLTQITADRFHLSACPSL
ncbi:hypothetical protein JOE48_004208 [Methylobacterium sp. PvR107]|nr:hypothetical protein [Methylobacterium sp. PvR107]